MTGYYRHGGFSGKGLKGTFPLALSSPLRGGGGIARLAVMDCPICGGERTRPLSTARRSFFRCDDCRFAWAAPSSRPDAAQALARYVLHRNEVDDAGYVSYLSAIIDRALAATGKSARKVVDWGSGPNPVCARLLRDRGLDVSIWDPAFASSSPPPRRSFDLALCIETAEHFLDPIADFREYASRLKSGGYAVVHTHFAPEDDAEFLRWWYIEDVTHVSFYTEESLRILGRIASLVVAALEDGKLAVFRRPLPILVAGGANLDVEGRPHAPLVREDSNPGTVRFAPGGTGRNIAEDLARLGLAVELVAAVGGDAAGAELAERTSTSGVGTTGMERMEGEASSCYLAVLDEAGDMAVAINGMGIYDRFDAGRALAAVARATSHAADTSFAADPRVPFSALVLDGNLLPETAEAILDRFPDLDAWFDPISTVKARRFAAYGGGVLLARLAAAKPNLMQAETMAAAVEAASFPPSATPQGTVEPARSESRESSARARRAALSLRSAGMGVIYVSLGSEGVYRLSAETAVAAQPPAAAVVSATGAGDAFLAGALRAAVLGLSAEDECAAGCATATIALASTEACPADLDAKRIEDLLSAWKRSGAIAWKEERI